MMTLPPFTLDPAAQIGAVALTVTNLDRAATFYETALGFTLRRRADGEVVLGVAGRDLLYLSENAQARHIARATGLYHFAVLVPSRRELGNVLRRIIQTETAVQGFADHGVSEAIYLADPDGNGIEVYRDRPRDAWPRKPDGTLAMVTDPIDLDGVLGEVEGNKGVWAGLHADTIIGHMHLKVADLDVAERFYCGLIGFDLLQRYGQSASFISAGGYHHHVGMNTWESAGALPPPPGSIGLRWFELRLPAATDISKIADRARGAGLEIAERQEGLLLHDPFRIGVMLVSA